MTSETTLQIAGIAVIGIALIFILKIISDSFGKAFAGIGEVLGTVPKAFQGSFVSGGNEFHTGALFSDPSKPPSRIDPPGDILGIHKLGCDFLGLFGQVPEDCTELTPAQGPPIDPRTGGVMGGVYGPFP